MEKLYTIPINEAFDACRDAPACGCPFCRLENTLEDNELELILGASMMEPDVRIKTNAQGFCQTHFGMMLQRQKRLPLALILESHLAEIRESTEPGGVTDMLKGAGTSCSERLSKLEKDCYVCSRVAYSIDKMFENAVWLWDTDPDFRTKTEAQPYICLPHYRKWLEYGKRGMNKKRYPDFYRAVTGVVNRYFDELQNDVSWFVKKFDYRYDNEPWGNAKDSVERAVRFLASDLHRPPDKK